MKTVLGLVLAASLCLAGCASARAQPRSPRADVKATAQAFMDALTKEDFAGAGRDFDSAMQKAMPPEKLTELWKAMTGQVGAFQKQLGLRTEPTPKHEVVWVTCRFEKLPLDFKIVFNADQQITGLFIVPAQSTAEYKPPAYVNQAAFGESSLTVGAGEWAVPGTLTLPKGDGPFPAVVLVHGSGPNDRDENILGNRPFRDLAWGLASRGVAVLRYDKRTRTHGHKMGTLLTTLTVKEEVIDDVLAAVSLLRQTKGIDPRRVFVLGHSLGGIVAPRLGLLDPQLAGLVILAGPSRPLADLVLDQFTYLYSLDGPISDKNKAELEKLRAQVARVHDPKLSPDTPAADLPLGMGAAYWLDLRAYPPAETALKIKQPLLILQGERDYQVTMEDFQGWKKILGARDNATLKSYPKLHHLFMEGAGEGKAKPAEYQKIGHVASVVIEDIAGWIKKH
jgi:dienelactone hydrolase